MQWGRRALPAQMPPRKPVRTYVSFSAFKSWQGASAEAAQARTKTLADDLEQHGQTASTVAAATKTAASEVRQIKEQLGKLRETLGQFGIMVDASSSRAVPVTDLSSLPAARRGLIEHITSMGQQSLNSIRLAADLTDANLAYALTPRGQRDDFDLDTRFVRAQGVSAPHPAGVGDIVIDTAQLTTGIAATTIMAHSKYFGCGSAGKHWK